MDSEKKREIAEGKRHVVAEENSSAAENCIPQNKLMSKAMMRLNQRKPLPVHEGEGTGNEQFVTEEQAGSAAGNLIAKKRMMQRYKIGQKKLMVTRTRPGGRLAQEALGSTGGSSLMRVPLIEACLRPDGSLLEELRADVVRTTTSFLKQKSKVLGKRLGCSDKLMQDGEHNLGRCWGEESDKKTRSEGQTTLGEQVEEVEKDEEATSLGAAGTLTGAEERACQEP